MAVKKQKSKLLRLMQSEENYTYETTEYDCIKWFRIINREIFKSTLSDVDEIDIRWRRGTHAFYECLREPDKRKTHTKLAMNKKYRSKKFFVEVLAHEMVHHYQFLNDVPLSHGESFMSWSVEFKKKGLNLVRAYEHED